MGKRKRKQMEEMETIEEKQETTLFDLLVEDIMMTYVAPYLRMEDLINLRLCSRKCKDLADIMFAGIRKYIGRYKQKQYPQFLKRTTRLRTFGITGSEYTDEIVHYVLSHNYLLEDVSINDCDNLTTWGLLPLAEYCKNISKLELIFVTISDDFLRALERHKLITVIFLINVEVESKERPSQAGLQAFFEKQKNIENVELLYTIDMSPIISTIANFCRNLITLDIAGCKLDDDKVLIELANKCPKLKQLNVDYVYEEILEELRCNEKYQHISICLPYGLPYAY